MVKTKKTASRKPSSPTKGSSAKTPCNSAVTPCPLDQKRTLRIRLMEGKSKILSNHAYELTIGGTTCSGVTDGSGFMEQEIAEGIQSATLKFDELIIDLMIHKDFFPVTATRGIQARLNNLGYEPGKVDGELGKHTKAAIKAFQRDNTGLTEDGIAGPQTQHKLVLEHGC
jgi:hypothetical protein